MPTKTTFTLVFILSVSASAEASLLYTDRQSYEAALTSFVVEDFENPGYAFVQNDAAMSAVARETRYSSTGFSNHNIITRMLVTSPITGNYYCAGCNGSFLLDFTSSSLSSGSGGVFGIGFDYFNKSSLLYHAFLTFGDNTTLDIALDQASYVDTRFFGISSDKLIKTAHLGLVDGARTTGGSFGLDNLTLGTGYVLTRGSAAAFPIPEPATPLLVGLGLAGLYLSSRRKR